MRVHYTFLTLGEAVELAWLRALCENAWTRRKSGTSFAMPIATGIVAFVLLYAYERLLEDGARSEYDKMRDYLA
ncbi:hypothetical protein C8A03DRAFT_35128 [Achaetomium macrosporum]|uniref:Uncharacterized protein n=1 Tax=Achaetomium macrosporum TaxID=79813 RepID=A0AAN7HB37_9PEZI|nr:hypothetical protein C8A03DRAFT_35128 [Achaetomium macrosporum]